MLLKPNDRILFQGDSVTDCGCWNDQDTFLGTGYPTILAGLLSARFPQYDLTFLNRAISGNRVVDLQGRWEKDCIDLAPTVVSILIGINNTWRRYDDAKDPTSAEKFEAGYRDLLDQIKTKLSARIVLMEPFVLPYAPDKEGWREDLDPKIQVIRRLAREYNAILVPLDGIFNAAAINKAACSYWTMDGVHPTAAGHGLIAQSWMRMLECE